jgi:hypothetical protein
MTMVGEIWVSACPLGSSQGKAFAFPLTGVSRSANHFICTEDK